ncbi:hypothetical protein ACJ2A9_21780 [Anaerobacillus sp. MEB173]|uniref:hypothetical protein n=1 Tax=Anaerobacillus sp. MEB173 TaxID=3383345 RepID=UPI003F8E3CCA
MGLILVFSTMLVFLIIIIKMQKRLTKLEMYATIWFALYFDLIVDVYLSFKNNLYGYFSEGIQYKMLLVFPLYPLFNIIFLNYFPFGSIQKQFLYIGFTTGFLICYEWLLVQTEVFYYNHWKLSYSALSYPLILYVLVWNLKAVRYFNQ